MTLLHVKASLTWQTVTFGSNNFLCSLVKLDAQLDATWFGRSSSEKVPVSKYMWPTAHPDWGQVSFSFPFFLPHLYIVAVLAFVSVASFRLAVVWWLAEAKKEGSQPAGPSGLRQSSFKQGTMPPLAAVCAVLRTPGSWWHMPSPLAALWQSTYHTGWGPPRGQSWGDAMGPPATMEIWLVLLLQPWKLLGCCFFFGCGGVVGGQQGGGHLGDLRGLMVYWFYPGGEIFFYCWWRKRNFDFL